MSDDEVEQYEIEAILNKRKHRGRIEYLIKWLGYDDAENTWESRVDLLADGLEEEIKNYDRKNKTPKKQRNGKSPARGSGLRSRGPKRDGKKSGKKKSVRKNGRKSVKKRSQTPRRPRTTASKTEDENGGDEEVRRSSRITTRRSQRRSQRRSKSSSRSTSSEKGASQEEEKGEEEEEEERRRRTETPRESGRRGQGEKGEGDSSPISRVARALSYEDVGQFSHAPTGGLLLLGGALSLVICAHAIAVLIVRGEQDTLPKGASTIISSGDPERDDAFYSILSQLAALTSWLPPFLLAAHTTLRTGAARRYHRLILLSLGWTTLQAFLASLPPSPSSWMGEERMMNLRGLSSAIATGALLAAVQCRGNEQQGIYSLSFIFFFFSFFFFFFSFFLFFFFSFFFRLVIGIVLVVLIFFFSLPLLLLNDGSRFLFVFLS